MCVVDPSIHPSIHRRRLYLTSHDYTVPYSTISVPVDGLPYRTRVVEVGGDWDMT